MNNKDSKKNFIIDYAFFVVMTAAAAVITFILFKNQAIHGVIYHESNFAIMNGFTSRPYEMRVYAFE